MRTKIKQDYIRKTPYYHSKMSKSAKFYSGQIYLIYSMSLWVSSETTVDPWLKTTLINRPHCLRIFDSLCMVIKKKTHLVQILADTLPLPLTPKVGLYTTVRLYHSVDSYIDYTVSNWFQLMVSFQIDGLDEDLHWFPRSFTIYMIYAILWELLIYWILQSWKLNCFFFENWLSGKCLLGH